MKQRKNHRVSGGNLIFLEHDSVACSAPMRVAVFVPPTRAKAQRFPVLFFLSGLTCNEENFVIKAGALQGAAELGLILVAPDTSPRNLGLPGEEQGWDFGSGAGFYVDATEPPWSEHYRMWTYVTDELPRLIDKHFPTLGPDARGISGHSMGGHGALAAALSLPSNYRSVSALAPICAPSHCPWGQRAFTGYLGPDRSTWDRYDASKLVAANTHPGEILIDQGLADEFLEEQLHPDRFENACKAAGQNLTLRRHEGYDHSYFFVQSFIGDHLSHHAKALSLL